MYLSAKLTNFHNWLENACNGKGDANSPFFFAALVAVSYKQLFGSGKPHVVLLDVVEETRLHFTFLWFSKEKETEFFPSFTLLTDRNR